MTCRFQLWSVADLWNLRASKRGVLIYWTVDKGGAMAVHSQLLECSASEVHAMVEGAMRHGTDMDIEANYVDTHGQSFIGFGVTRLLGFDLLPRIKQINRCKLYLPAAGDLDRYPRLRPALTNPIRWELIEQQYDLMMKYATAIRLGTASTEAILRRFNSDVTHPAYAAMLEVGRAQRTIFIARYLRDRDLQREINAGLNVVENYNGVNDYIFFGKSGELSSNRREEQEISMICLQILQSCLGYLDDSGHSRRARVGRPAWRCRSARPDPAVHREHDALRRDPAQPRSTPEPGCGRPQYLTACGQPAAPAGCRRRRRAPPRVFRRRKSARAACLLPGSSGLAASSAACRAAPLDLRKRRRWRQVVATLPTGLDGRRAGGRRSGRSTAVRSGNWTP